MASRDQLKIEAALDLILAGHLDDATRRIVEAWAQAWDRLRPEVEASLSAVLLEQGQGRVTGRTLMRDARLQAALEAVYGALSDLADRAPQIAGTILTGTVASAVDGNQAMIRAGLTGALRAELRSAVVGADAGQVAAIIERSTQQITARSKYLAADAQAAIREHITRGVVVGENPRRAAQLAFRGIEDQWNGGIARASTIARTEMIDAHRTAAQRTHEANADVLAGWEWVAHLGDRRACRACLGMHGTTHDVDAPGPLGHPNCRCARVPVTKSWEDLGFPGMREATSKTPDADDWFTQLPEADQRAILTDAGWEKWKRGEWPREKWASRRQNPDWRPSYQPASPR